MLFEVFPFSHLQGRRLDNMKRKICHVVFLCDRPDCESGCLNLGPICVMIVPVIREKDSGNIFLK